MLVGQPPGSLAAHGPARGVDAVAVGPELALGLRQRGHRSLRRVARPDLVGAGLGEDDHRPALGERRIALARPTWVWKMPSDPRSPAPCSARMMGYGPGIGLRGTVVGSVDPDDPVEEARLCGKGRRRHHRQENRQGQHRPEHRRPYMSAREIVLWQAWPFHGSDRWCGFRAVPAGMTRWSHSVRASRHDLGPEERAN